MEKVKFYTGIGSRETPKEIIDLFKKVAMYLANKDYILRSGGVKGADQAFETGCDEVNVKKEIYLPWNRFENSDSNLIVSADTNSKAYQIAEKFHPYWHNLSQGAKKLQARNSHQVLGGDLNTPTDFIICWTKNGKGQGGTGQAIRIAKGFDISIFDAGEYSDLNKVRENLKIFLKGFVEEG